MSRLGAGVQYKHDTCKKYLARVDPIFYGDKLDGGVLTHVLQCTKNIALGYQKARIDGKPPLWHGGKSQKINYYKKCFAVVVGLRGVLENILIIILFFHWTVASNLLYYNYSRKQKNANPKGE